MEIDLTGLVLPERVEAAEASDDGRSARFVIEPLERGYGHTLGNSVRRVLLSSLRGAAVWAFRIDGVVHEHQTIQGVVEDVHQVIQNLKSLVIMLDDDVEEATLEIKAVSSGPVTAEMIQAPSGVEVLDPGHHIMTLQDDRELNIELYVNKGRGFILSDQHELPRGAPVDLVRIDAIYNPVRRANFSVEETRVGQRTDFDRLTLHVETDGSVSPEDAVRYASALVRKHLEYMLYFGEGGIPQPTPPGAVAVPERLQDLFSRPIEDLAELSVRSRNSLQKENIRTLGDLVQKTEDAMLAIENFGKKSLKEIVDFLEEHDLRFGMKLEEGDDGQMYFVEEAEAETADAD
ncbi:MAG: DNA-directed RNA polymerase subunit alpha [Gemmatimonadetes bacterium]|nr:DNA-directed RNA polymerase subunit alpha [Gemmatimonadota bacterium]MBT8405622.1 DNA-directed RNA polymerase subunit alpha [Gemmatimonadota bacterium]NNK64586.1 DNA-directed RNA polymerase subunit alpha [Gemmatimonadota bacterium]